PTNSERSPGATRPRGSLALGHITVTLSAEISDIWTPTWEAAVGSRYAEAMSRRTVGAASDRHECWGLLQTVFECCVGFIDRHTRTYETVSGLLIAP
ncbi:MAG: hypothetical protein OXG57_03480, partial [Acidimicrobiaceae bacterium]|nr:hypothetical protein [Acidimicrobiaceae bacterium]